MALYAVDGPDSTTLLEVKTLPRSLDAGTSSASLVFETTYGQMGRDGFMIRADDDGTMGIQTECDEGNNEAWVDDWPC